MTALLVLEPRDPVRLPGGVAETLPGWPRGTRGGQPGPSCRWGVARFNSVPPCSWNGGSGSVPVLAPLGRGAPHQSFTSSGTLNRGPRRQGGHKQALASTGAGRGRRKAGITTPVKAPEAVTPSSLTTSRQREAVGLSDFAMRLSVGVRAIGSAQRRACLEKSICKTDRLSLSEFAPSRPSAKIVRAGPRSISNRSLCRPQDGRGPFPNGTKLTA